MLTSPVLSQIARDPTLSVDGVHHDRITDSITQPSLIGIVADQRFMRSMETSTDFFGKDHAVEVTYEYDPLHERRVIVHNVVLIRTICKKGEYWYDGNGNFRKGPRQERTDVTGQLDDDQIQTIGCNILDGISSLRRSGRAI